MDSRNGRTGSTVPVVTATDTATSSCGLGGGGGAFFLSTTLSGESGSLDALDRAASSSELVLTLTSMAGRAGRSAHVAIEKLAALARLPATCWRPRSPGRGSLSARR